MAPKDKIRQAFTLTRSLGIPDAEVKPVLRHLLNVYEKNWEFIEEDNYRTLIDSYYEFNKHKRTDDGNGSGTGMNDFERPSKRPHLEEQPKVKASSSKEESESVDLISTEDDDDDIPIPRKTMDQETSGQVKAEFVPSQNRRKDIARSNRSITEEKGESPIPRKTMGQETSGKVKVEFALSQTQREDIARSNKCREFVEPKIVSAANLTQSALPSRVCSSSSLVSTLRFSSSDNSDKGLATSLRNVDNIESSAKTNGYGSSARDIILASSPTGEVKLFLTCQKNFHIPKLDVVLRHLENKYLRQYKHLRPQISIAKLLEDICQSYLNLGSDSSKNSSRVGTSTGVTLRDSKAREGPSPRQLIVNGSERGGSRRSLNSTVNGSTSSTDVVQRKPATSDKKRSTQNIGDIAKGAENVKISLVDEIGNENLPNFNYIPHNIIYQNARVQVSLARISDEDCCSSCSGDCLSSELPCACTGETGGEFAYTPKGQVKEEFLEACISMSKNPQEQHFVYCEDCPHERAKNEDMPEKCKGHAVRKFIKECWRRCGCDMKCGNRVVQRGITCNLQVFVTQEGKGWGVRTLEDLPKGTFVCEYVGEIVTNNELYERNMQSSGTERHTYPVNLDADWGSEQGLADEDALSLDATYNGNVARFINHRCCDGNLIDIPVQIETPDRHYYHLAYFTNRAVPAYEELTWDYGLDFNDVNHPIKAFRCCCGSEFCRDKGRKGSKSKAKLLR